MKYKSTVKISSLDLSTISQYINPLHARIQKNLFQGRGVQGIFFDNFTLQGGPYPLTPPLSRSTHALVPFLKADKLMLINVDAQLNMFYLLGDSNINVTVSALSPAFNVMTSSLLAHFRTLDMLQKKLKQSLKQS